MKACATLLLYNKSVVGCGMRNTTGQVVRGKDFFDREHEQIRFWRDLETDNLLLLAPRRVGKTSLMRRLGEAAPDKGYTAVFVDVSDAGGEAVFVGRLYQAVLETEASNALWGQMEKSWLGKLFRRVKKISGPGFSVEFDPGQADDWPRLGRDLADALSGLEGRWLLQIDELPVFFLKLLNAGDAARERATRSTISASCPWGHSSRIRLMPCCRGYPRPTESISPHR